MEVLIMFFTWSGIIAWILGIAGSVYWAHHYFHHVLPEQRRKEESAHEYFY